MSTLVPTLTYGLTLCLCLMTIFGALYLRAIRKSRQDRIVLGLIGVMSIYQGSCVLRELGLWDASVNTQVDALATLSVVAMGFLTVYVIGRAGSDAQRVPAAAEAEKADKSAVLTAAPAPAQPVGAMLQTVLQALPFPIRITGPQGEVLFSNSLVEEAGESAASGWSAPVGNASVGIRVHIDAPVTVPQAEKKEEQLTAADILADPRRQLRIPVNLSVEVEVLDDAKLTVTGETINFSGNGLALRVPGPLNVGANVAIRAGEDLLLGEVKYCQDAYPGYRVGIQLQQTLAAPAGETQTRDSADPVGGRGAWR